MPRRAEGLGRFREVMSTELGGQETKRALEIMVAVVKMLPRGCSGHTKAALGERGDGWVWGASAKLGKCTHKSKRK